MRFFVGVAACFCVFGGTVLAQGTAAPAPAAAPPAAMDEKTVADITSYGIGMNVGRGLKNDGLTVNLDALLAGIRDSLQGAEPKYSREQLQAAFKSLEQTLQTKRVERDKTAGDKNKTEGLKFLADNKTRQGVTTLPSGLQYQVLRAGNGASPKLTDTVKVHYEGTLIDGKVFDSSIKRKEPAVFPVNGVISGWTEALQLMKVGDHWRLFVPSNLAYAEQGAGELIGPNAVLIFDVELLDILPPSR